jgi:hypothetical protein
MVRRFGGTANDRLSLLLTLRTLTAVVPPNRHTFRTISPLREGTDRLPAKRTHLSRHIPASTPIVRALPDTRQVHCPDENPKFTNQTHLRHYLCDLLNQFPKTKPHDQHTLAMFATIRSDDRENAIAKCPTSEETRGRSSRTGRPSSSRMSSWRSKTRMLYDMRRVRLLGGFT